MNTDATLVTNELCSFLSRAHSPYHAVKLVADEMQDKGYELLTEAEPWNLKKGGRYLLTRAGTTLAAFRIPTDAEPQGFMICATHSDSPCFKVKEQPELITPGYYTRLSTEGYGGMILSSWLDRPLSVAGRVVLETKDGVQARLIDIDRDLLLIPNVAIHMNRAMNSGYAYNTAVDLVPLFSGDDEKGKFKKLLAKEAGTAEEAILGTDLFLYLRQAPSVWGGENEFISAPRLDDQQCAFAAAKGFLSSENQNAIPVFVMFDNEEIGSETMQGAGSTFLADLLSSISEAMGITPENHKRLLAHSMMVSADNAHAVHPNHPEYADTTHRPKINGGIVIKHSAPMRYTTDGLSSALFTALCKRASVPVQHFANRSDLPGGSTLGAIASSGVSILSIDVGLPQLAMHSSYETAGVHDTAYLTDALSLFFSSSLTIYGDSYQLT